MFVEVGSFFCVRFVERFISLLKKSRRKQKYSKKLLGAESSAIDFTQLGHQKCFGTKQKLKKNWKFQFFI